MKNKNLIVGNWKLNPNSLDLAKEIARKTRSVAKILKNTEVVICPPDIYIDSCSSVKDKSLILGAQNVSIYKVGPHTGEVSAEMLKSVGVEYVIVGHSEQREDGESNDTISKKAKMCLDADLVPIICVGEKNRDENGVFLEELKNQIVNSLSDIPKVYSKSIVVAYEPVWAIGGDEAMMPEAIYETALFIKKVYSDLYGTDPALKLKILYGGSVNSTNAKDIISRGKVDGLLIGRESINIKGFVELLKSVD